MSRRLFFPSEACSSDKNSLSYLAISDFYPIGVEKRDVEESSRQEGDES